MTSLERVRPEDLPADPDAAASWWMIRRMLTGLSDTEDMYLAAWLEDAENAQAYERARRADDAIATLAADPQVIAKRTALLRAFPAPKPVTPWRRWAVAASIAVCVLAGAGTYMASRLDTGTVAPAASEHYVTQIGERRSFRLDDGSQVELNSGTAIEVAYTHTRRSVRLVRGEAKFDVAHNRTWPFIVAAGDRTVTALGTAFTVRKDGPSLNVVLVEGAVKVDPMRPKGLGRLLRGVGSETLSAGEQLAAVEGRPEVRVSVADLERATSWTTDRIIFRGDRLETAVAEMNRYTTRHIVINDPKVADLKINGVFSTKRPENFVVALTEFYPVAAKTSKQGVTELSWKATSDR